jgi:tetratricopeptide (TPR) repeat protein
LSDSIGEIERARFAYEKALEFNPSSSLALRQIAFISKSKEKYGKAIEYFHRFLNLEKTNGEIWAVLGHCYLIIDDLAKAYSSYQYALQHLHNQKDPYLWYGIAVLYERYLLYDKAEETFLTVLKMDPNFEKSSEIYYRLGMLYFQKGKYEISTQCFKHIMSTPPPPLKETDILFQIGCCYEQQMEFHKAKEVFENILEIQPKSGKALQHLGWIYCNPARSFFNISTGMSLLEQSLEADSEDSQTWYFLGRCYISRKSFMKSYECYKQAVQRNGNNPIYWCSIGVLYQQINQYRDSLDAYRTSIKLNPFMSETWYNLGTLYESSTNQIKDAVEAYSRALELDPLNKTIKERLAYLRVKPENSS